MAIVRLPTGDLRDEVRQPLYDTIIIEAGSTINDDRRFFNNVQGKPKYQTNLRQNNSLETAKSFRIQGLGIECHTQDSTKQKALALIMRNSALEMQVGEKIYFEAPMKIVAGRLWQNAALAGDTDAATFLQQFGEPSCNAVQFGNKHFVDIEPLQSFSVRFKTEGLVGAELTAATPSAAESLYFICLLKGLLRRPVQ